MLRNPPLGEGRQNVRLPAYAQFSHKPRSRAKRTCNSEKVPTMIFGQSGLGQGEQWHASLLGAQHSFVVVPATKHLEQVVFFETILSLSTCACAKAASKQRKQENGQSFHMGHG